MRGRFLAVVFAVVLAVALPGISAEAERPAGSAATLARARVLYVWATDIEARDAYANLFTDFGATFSTVHVDQVAAADLSLFDYIVIGHDTARDGDHEWGAEGEDDEEHIFTSGRSILGLGDGGAFFWDSVGVEWLGWLFSAVSNDASAVIVHMPAHPAWTGPNPLSVSDGDTVTMYSQGASAAQLSTTDDPPTSTYEGENANPDDATYYLILNQGPRQLQWGFNAIASNLTDDGKFALTNFLASAPRFFAHSAAVPMVAAGQ